MKIGLLLLLCASACLAQDFRTVEGKLYNSRYSTNWTTLPAGSFLMRVDQLLTNGIVIKEFQRHFVRTSPPNSWQQGTQGHKPEGAWQEIPGKEYVLRNYPDRNVVAGQTISKPVRALRTGTTDVKGKVYALFDCGIPYVAPQVSK